MKAICSIGGEEINTGFDEDFEHTYKGKPCCKKHYFELLGDFIEKNPIGGIGTR